MYLKITQRLSRYLDHYISPRLIFALDFVLSVIASLATVTILSFISENFSDFAHSHFTFVWLIAAAIATVLVSLVSRCYRVAIRHTTPMSNLYLSFAILAKSAIATIATYFVVSEGDNLRNYILTGVGDFLITIFFLIGIRVLMYAVYTLYRDRMKAAAHTINILIYGTNDKSVSLIKRLDNSLHYDVKGCIIDKTKFDPNNIATLPVYQFHDINDVERIFVNNNIGGVLFAHDVNLKEVDGTIIKYCNDHKLKILTAPPIDGIETKKLKKDGIRNVKIEDLLGRDEIEVNFEEIKKHFQGKRVMVTGAAGSIGSEICRQLAQIGVKELVLFDDAETPTHNLRLELEEKYPGLNFHPTIGDVRHKKRLDGMFRRYKPQVVFHAAAYKHVPLMEENPCEAVMVNVYGSRNVADKCVEYGVEMMVMISTDKAVNPTNVMGCSKRLAEIYVQSLGTAIANGVVKGNTKFVTTRFGNVLGSNGSVIPRFRKQIEEGGPVTVTHREIERFFMTIPEACRLVMEAAMMSKGNQIFVFDMGDPVKIADLAHKMISLAGLEEGTDIEIKFTGLRPGEKLFEEVLSKLEGIEDTPHPRIKVASVRQYQYAEISEVINKLHELADLVEIDELVKLMKATVPEYKSKNSQFEKFDN